MNSSKENPPKKHRLWKPEAPPAEDGESIWLLSYADLMSLMFGFFVILTSFSTPDTTKLEKLKKETAKSFDVKYEDPYQDLRARLENILVDYKLDKEVELTNGPEGIAIVSRGTLFFDVGKAELQKTAEKLLAQMGSVLAREGKGFRISVEGHTDDTPISTGYFASNWELSSTRASTVVRLFEHQGIAHQNLRPIGLADTEPLQPNRDLAGIAVPSHQAQNRRIVIRIQKK
ncbi:flagellar motor protein MotB [bacterium]|nr:flagellar motor protein MotB [bacterium]